MRRIALWGFAAIVFLIGCKKDVSGSYLASDKDTICWLLLVRTPDNHLTGHLVCSVLKPDGQINQESVSLTGAVDGENVALVGGGFLGMSGTALSGTFDGSTLTLTGVQAAPAILRRATLAEYQMQLGKQSKQAQAIVAERTAAELRLKASLDEQSFDAEIEQLSSRMQQFNGEVDVHLARFPNAEKRYESITAKIGELVAQERQLAGNPNASTIRAQFVSAATQASFTTDQMHFQAQSLESSLDTNIAPLLKTVETLKQGCQRYEPSREYPEPTPAEVEAHQDACRRLLSAEPLFRSKYNAISTGLSHIESVYAREKVTQQNLLATAQKME